jgi:hypothetical protein
MTRPRPAVRLATVADAEPIADLLADAFLDYEWSRWAVPADDRRERLRGLHLLDAGLVGAEAGSTWVTDDITSVADWVKPGRTPISEELRTLRKPNRSLRRQMIEQILRQLDARSTDAGSAPWQRNGS